uniref:Branched-chain-amino-acid aminotransferase n=1 Tax=Callorhinchus milii TaxID=7868 RepID=A0A4W3JP76_CALMI
MCNTFIMANVGASPHTGHCHSDKGFKHETAGGCSGPGVDSFKVADLEIELVKAGAEKPDENTLGFGTVFTDHMLMINWSERGGWEKPHIRPLQNLSLHPAASALHYSVELFEGLKAYRGVDDKIRLFRPMLNMERMLRSAHRTCLPSFDKEELLKCIMKLVEIDKDWVPNSTTTSLYIRPTFIGTESSLGVKKSTKALLYVILSPAACYFAEGNLSAVSLWADPKYVRAWHGGTGDCKMGGNYGASIYAQYEAINAGCQQVLWLYGDDHKITEAGTMNLFVYWINENGEEELVTPPLDGIILPGVTRQCLLDLGHKWNEFRVQERTITMNEVLRALKENRVKEIFGSGTACSVCPVTRILYKGENLIIPTKENGPELAKRFLKHLTEIQVTPWDVLPT